MVACYAIFLKILTEIGSFFRSFAALQLLACVVHGVHERYSHSITGNRHLTREQWRSRFVIPPQTHNTSPKTLGFNSIVGVGLCKRIEQQQNSPFFYKLGQVCINCNMKWHVSKLQYFILLHCSSAVDVCRANSTEVINHSTTGPRTSATRGEWCPAQIYIT